MYKNSKKLSVTKSFPLNLVDEKKSDTSLLQIIEGGGKMCYIYFRLIKSTTESTFCRDFAVRNQKGRATTGDKGFYE